MDLLHGKPSKDFRANYCALWDAVVEQAFNQVRRWVAWPQQCRAGRTVCGACTVHNLCMPPPSRHGAMAVAWVHAQRRHSLSTGCGGDPTHHP